MPDKEHEGAPKKFEDTELQALLEEDLCRSLNELSKKLNVDRCQSLRRRLDGCIMAQGGHFQQFI
ncbi:hypothetical protein ALC57_02939 [Trachymyrmex cornetzi]|uniref:Uncharacterized protein n=1 Tax=Trachymyrmex cornetzi TaxID=471704 RepID=A0A151JMV5_9HYME|nr:hypothetical protein ALC57_02939 [Trachymyrmex cornetzi]